MIPKFKFLPFKLSVYLEISSTLILDLFKRSLSGKKKVEPFSYGSGSFNISKIKDYFVAVLHVNLLTMYAN